MYYKSFMCLESTTLLLTTRCSRVELMWAYANSRSCEFVIAALHTNKIKNSGYHQMDLYPFIQAMNFQSIIFSYFICLYITYYFFLHKIDPTSLLYDSKPRLIQSFYRRDWMRIVGTRKNQVIYPNSITGICHFLLPFP